MSVLSNLPIHSAQGDYEVTFAASVAEAVRLAASHAPTAVVVDARVKGLWKEALAPIIETCPTLELAATEENKTLQGVEVIGRFLQAAGADRKARVLAVGGGIIQDLVAFTTHSYYRGIAWSFLPTTLLSMSDSCIGAKCGINLGEWKNQWGVFQSPAGVTIATQFLDTLDDIDVASGYGEILKLALTGSVASFQRLEQIVEIDGLRGPKLAELVRESLVVKKAVIEEDEYESGLRQILNYGHTFGHALEAATHHSVPHGLGVAWGIDVVNALATRRDLLDPVWADRVRRFVARWLTCPVSMQPTAEQLLKGVRRDKKAIEGSVTLVYMREPGRLERVPTPLDGALEADLSDYLARHDVFTRP